MAHGHSSRFLTFSERAVVFAGHRTTLVVVTVVVLIWGILGALARFPTEWFLLSN